MGRVLTEFDKLNLKNFIDRFTNVVDFKAEVLEYLGESMMNREDFIFFHKQAISMVEGNDDKLVIEYVSVVNSVLYEVI